MINRPKPQVQRLQPEEALVRMDLLAALKALSNSKGSSLVSSEEFLEGAKEFYSFASSFYRNVPFDLRTVNPTIIVGETNTSTDKAARGTVESTRYFESKPKPLGDIISHQVAEYFDKLYEDLALLSQTFKSRNYKNVEAILSDAIGSKRARLNLNRAFRREKSLSILLRQQKKATSKLKKQLKKTKKNQRKQSQR